MSYNPFLKPGFLEIYCGPMKSGKTVELIHRVENLFYMDEPVAFFKPAVDMRDNKICSRNNGKSIDCILVNEPEDILDNVKESSVVVFDETQFFPLQITQMISDFVKQRKNVICAGLDLDFRGEPFGPMPYLLSMANKIVKLTAVCEYGGCNSIATRTQRLINGEPASYNSPLISVEIISRRESEEIKETYEARCLAHHFVPD